MHRSISRFYGSSMALVSLPPCGRNNTTCEDHRVWKHRTSDLAIDEEAHFTEWSLAKCETAGEVAKELVRRIEILPMLIQFEGGMQMYAWHTQNSSFPLPEACISA